MSLFYRQGVTNVLTLNIDCRNLRAKSGGTMSGDIDLSPRLEGLRRLSHWYAAGVPPPPPPPTESKWPGDGFYIEEYSLKENCREDVWIQAGFYSQPLVSYLVNCLNMPTTNNKLKIVAICECWNQTRSSTSSPICFHPSVIIRDYR